MVETEIVNTISRTEYEAKEKRFINRYLELREVNDTKKMEVVRNNFHRIFGYSILQKV